MPSNKCEEKVFAHSAVMVLYEHDSDSLILTKRSDRMRTHPGEICFPGGIREEMDINYYATALRELQEELNITADRVTLIKPLKTERTVLGTIIHPWYARIESVHPYLVNTQEVDRILTIPMSLVCDAKNYRSMLVERNNRKFISYEFTAHKDWVWGATARIMMQLVKSI